MGEIRVDRGWPDFDPVSSAARPWSGANNPHSPQKGERARLGTVGGCARVHECIVTSERLTKTEKEQILKKRIRKK